MNSPSYHDRLVDLLRRTYGYERDLVASLTDEERAMPSSMENWSIKDLVSHMTYWRERQAQSLREADLRLENDTEEVQAINERVYNERKDLPWPAVIEDAGQSVEALIAAVSERSESDLTDPARFAWRNHRPMIQSVLGNGVYHPVAHLSEIMMRRGQNDVALRMQEEMVAGYTSLDNSPASRGIVLYNLACFYALNSMKDRALRHLEEALSLRPDLTEWSRQDPDFVSLRDDPNFQKLYG